MVSAGEQGRNDLGLGRRKGPELDQVVNTSYGTETSDVHSKDDDEPPQGFKQGVTRLGEPLRLFWLP